MSLYSEEKPGGDNGNKDNDDDRNNSRLIRKQAKTFNCLNFFRGVM